MERFEILLGVHLFARSVLLLLTAAPCLEAQLAQDAPETSISIDPESGEVVFLWEYPADGWIPLYSGDPVSEGWFFVGNDYFGIEDGGWSIRTDSTSAALFRLLDYFSYVDGATGVEQTSSGLRYIVFEEGTGNTPTMTDTVTLHYTGKFVNGTVFDTTESSGQPVTWNLSEFSLISGFSEALMLLKEGGRTRFFIPSNLGYGEMGQVNPITNEYVIPPYAILVFDIELISID